MTPYRLKNSFDTAGQQSELIHDIFDEYIVQQKVDTGQSIDSPEDFEYSPMTTWDNDMFTLPTL